MVSKLNNMVLYASNGMNNESMAGGKACIVRIRYSAYLRQ